MGADEEEETGTRLDDRTVYSRISKLLGEILTEMPDPCFGYFLDLPFDDRIISIFL